MKTSDCIASIKWILCISLRPFNTLVAIFCFSVFILSPSSWNCAFPKPHNLGSETSSTRPCPPGGILGRKRSANACYRSLQHLSWHSLVNLPCISWHVKRFGFSHHRHPMPPNDVPRLTLVSEPTPSFPLETFQMKLQTWKLRFNVNFQYSLRWDGVLRTQGI